MNSKNKYKLGSSNDSLTKMISVNNVGVNTPQYLDLNLQINSLTNKCFGVRTNIG